MGITGNYMPAGPQNRGSAFFILRPLWPQSIPAGESRQTAETGGPGAPLTGEDGKVSFLTDKGGICVPALVLFHLLL